MSVLYSLILWLESLACFSSTLLVTDQERVGAESLFASPAFPCFPSCHFSYLIVKSVSWQRDSGEGKVLVDRSTVRVSQRPGFSNVLGVCRKRTHYHTLLTVLYMRDLESLLSKFLTCILLIEKLTILI